MEKLSVLQKWLWVNMLGVDSHKFCNLIIAMFLSVIGTSLVYGILTIIGIILHFVCTNWIILLVVFVLLTKALYTQFCNLS